MMLEYFLGQSWQLIPFSDAAEQFLNFLDFMNNDDGYLLDHQEAAHKIILSIVPI